MSLKIALVSSLLVGGFVLVGCKESDTSPSASDVAREAEEAARTAGAFGQAKIDEYKRSTREGIAAINASLDRFETRVGELSGEAKAEAQEQLDDLRARRDKLMADIDQASADSADAWDDLVNGLDRARADLESAVQSAADRFGSAPEPTGGP